MYQQQQASFNKNIDRLNRNLWHLKRLVMYSFISSAISLIFAVLVFLKYVIFR